MSPGSRYYSRYSPLSEIMYVCIAVVVCTALSVRSFIDVFTREIRHSLSSEYENIY